VYGDILVSEGGTVGWAVRRSNPELAEALAKVAKTVEGGTQTGNVLLNRYLAKTTWIKNAGAERDRANFDRFVDLFKKYGDQYGFDWLALSAQAYQESSLDPNAKSAVGAVGLMQLLPSTGADMGYTNLEDPEQNVAAGAKYMAWIRSKYFDDPSLSPEDQLAFSWAAYNAGPNRIQRLRGRADDLGLDSDRWFHNVEYVVLEKVGQEPVRYVGNIYKYYVTYRLMLGLEAARGETDQ
jgi:membrane-bound lytic murein transglycosylase MltF